MTQDHSNLFFVNDHDFEQQVLHSTLPVIVDFTAEWCPPCRALAPVYARLSAAYEGRLRFAKMDTDDNTATPARLGIQGIPTLILFVDGKAAGRLVGPHPQHLQQSIDNLLAQANVKTAAV